jgi:7-cyano-7-deazaguanine reductase
MAGAAPDPACENCRMSSQPSRTLSTFPNPSPKRDFLIHMEVPEFTCLCPMTGQPDFATFTIDYIPDATCIELKSLKLYMWSYRNEGAFHEAVTNRILDDLVDASRPRFMRIAAKWYVRGGIFTTVVAEHRKPGWTPATKVELPEFAAASPMAGTGPDVPGGRGNESLA